MIPGLAGAQNPSSIARATFIESVRTLGIDGGLKLLVDAGDGLSYPGSGQTVTDRSGNNNMIRGATGGAEATDMPWTGTVDGRSSAEYFYSSDVALDQHLRLVGPPAWMNTIHQNNAKFAAAGWVYVVPLPSVGGSQFIEDNFSDPAEVGFGIGTAVNAHANAGKIVVSIGNGSGTYAAEVNSSGVVPTNQWVYFAVLVDEAAGTYTIWVNGSQTNGAISYSSPSGAAAARDMLTAYAGTGYRNANLAMWQGTVPTAAQLGALFQATRDKFGI